MVSVVSPVSHGLTISHSLSQSFLSTSLGLHGLCSLPSLLWSFTVSHSFRCSPLVSMVSVVSPVSHGLSLTLTHSCVRPLVSMVSVVSPVSHGLSLTLTHSCIRPLVSMVSVVSPWSLYSCVRPLVSMVSVVSPVSHGLSLSLTHSCVVVLWSPWSL